MALSKRGEVQIVIKGRISRLLKKKGLELMAESKSSQRLQSHTQVLSNHHSQHTNNHLKLAHTLRPHPFPPPPFHRTVNTIIPRRAVAAAANMPRHFQVLYPEELPKPIIGAWARCSLALRRNVLLARAATLAGTAAVSLYALERLM